MSNRSVLSIWFYTCTHVRYNSLGSASIMTCNNPEIVWKCNKRYRRLNKMKANKLMWTVFFQDLRGDSDETSSRNKVHLSRSITHDMNTKPSWINWVGINLKLWQLHSQECRVENNRKPPAFKEHGIEEEDPTSTFGPSGQVEMDLRCRLIFWGPVARWMSASQNLNQVRLKIQTATGYDRILNLYIQSVSFFWEKSRFFCPQ